MGQSATLYRISSETLFGLKERSDLRFDISLAKDFETFEGSFVGLEYVLSKVDEGSKASIVTEIFNPSQTLSDVNFDNFDNEDVFEKLELDDIISYLDISVICELDNFFSFASDDEVLKYFNPEELNMNNVYPMIWHGDNSPDLAFNQIHFMQDFSKLKRLFRKAAEEGDYILTLVG